MRYDRMRFVPGNALSGLAFVTAEEIVQNRVMRGFREIALPMAPTPGATSITHLRQAGRRIGTVWLGPIDGGRERGRLRP